MVGTYIVNSTKKEYTSIGIAYPTEMEKYLIRLEGRGWDLRKDNIYVSYSNKLSSYSLVLL
jgi:hypothetical protein